MYHLGDTIAAIASAPGAAARGIVRVSGPAAIGCVAATFEAADSTQSLAAARIAARRLSGALKLASLSSPLPVDLYLWPTARSYTREPIVEIHTLGSRPLLAAVLAEVCRRGARPAEPGEFTLRAFLSGRLDLTQAEAVLGVIEAQGPRQLSTALRQLAGGISGAMTRARDELLDVLAELEAGLDFTDEDIEFISAAQLSASLAHIAGELQELIAQLGSRTRLHEAPRIVLAGSPNVGKSSLFNRLADRGAALVSATAGTTRDYLSAPLTLDGRVCELIDTAGLGDASETGLPNTVLIETLASDAASDQHAQADLELFCLDATRPLNPWERDHLARPAANRVLVLTKTDSTGVEMASDPPCIRTSSVTGAGLDELRKTITARLGEIQAGDHMLVAATAHRCFDSLQSATAALRRAGELANQRGQEDLIAVEARVALAELGKIVGAVYTDDLLDRIFSRFCIGK